MGSPQGKDRDDCRLGSFRKFCGGGACGRLDRWSIIVPVSRGALPIEWDDLSGDLGVRVRSNSRNRLRTPASW